MSKTRVLVIQLVDCQISDLPATATPAGVWCGLRGKDRYGLLSPDGVAIVIEIIGSISLGVLSNFVTDLVKAAFQKHESKHGSDRQAFINGECTDCTPASVREIVCNVIETDLRPEHELIDVQGDDDHNPKLPIPEHANAPVDEFTANFLRVWEEVSSQQLRSQPSSKRGKQ